MSSHRCSQSFVARINNPVHDCNHNHTHRKALFLIIHFRFFRNCINFNIYDIIIISLISSNELLIFISAKETKMYFIASISDLLEILLFPSTEAIHVAQHTFTWKFGRYRLNSHDAFMSHGTSSSATTVYTLRCSCNIQRGKFVELLVNTRNGTKIRCEWVNFHLNYNLEHRSDCEPLKLM